jgi:large subunit ribosomal protein L4
MKVVLTSKLQKGKLVVVDGLPLESHRTKEFLEVLKGLELDKKVLVVDQRENRNLYLSCRNLPDVKMVPVGGVNIFDLLKYEHLLISKSALLELQTQLQR